MTTPTRNQLEAAAKDNSMSGLIVKLIDKFGPWVFSWVALGFLWVSYEQKNKDVSTLANSVITLMVATNQSISNLTKTIDEGHEKVNNMSPVVESLLDAVKANGKQIDTTSITTSENNKLLHELNARVKGQSTTQ